MSNDQLSDENQAEQEYLNTFEGSFSAGLEAGGLTLAQAVGHMIPFLDTYYADREVAAAWKRTEIQGTSTKKVATQIDAKVTAGFSLGLAGYPCAA